MLCYFVSYILFIMNRYVQNKAMEYVRTFSRHLWSQVPEALFVLFVLWLGSISLIGGYILSKMSKNWAIFLFFFDVVGGFVLYLCFNIIFGPISEALSIPNKFENFYPSYIFDLCAVGGGYVIGKLMIKHQEVYQHKVFIMGAIAAVAGYYITTSGFNLFSHKIDFMEEFYTYLELMKEATPEQSKEFFDKINAPN